MLKFIKRFFLFLFFIILVIVAVPLVQIADYYNLIPRRSYNGEDFGINTIYSTVDYNGNGVDDYTDILLGARQDAENHPRYDGSYQQEGYPPDDIGVCTDVVWRAFKNAGYSLRYMVDRDIMLAGLTALRSWIMKFSSGSSASGIKFVRNAIIPSMVTMVYWVMDNKTSMAGKTERKIKKAAFAAYTET